ncbi:hypothetical protein [Pseudomonas aeruginosa]
MTSSLSNPLKKFTAV